MVGLGRKARDLVFPPALLSPFFMWKGFFWFFVFPPLSDVFFGLLKHTKFKRVMRCTSRQKPGGRSTKLSHLRFFPPNDTSFLCAGAPLPLRTGLTALEAAGTRPVSTAVVFICCHAKSGQKADQSKVRPPSFVAGDAAE